jgi:hypothetical protein
MAEIPNTGISSPHQIPPYTLLGGPENIKLLFDNAMALMQQSVADNQANARALADLNLRRATNSATIDHLGNLNAVISAQAGDTSSQQTVSPVRTGVGDTVAASAYPADRSVDTASAGIAAAVTESVQTNVTSQVSALAAQIGTLTTMVNDLAGSVTTNLQAVADSNAAIAAALVKIAAK